MFIHLVLCMSWKWGLAYTQYNNIIHLLGPCAVAGLPLSTYLYYSITCLICTRMHVCNCYIHTYIHTWLQLLRMYVRQHVYFVVHCMVPDSAWVVRICSGLGPLDLGVLNLNQHWGLRCLVTDTRCQPHYVKVFQLVAYFLLTMTPRLWACEL